ncbi:MAG: carbon-nitrogen hydrolase family protein [Acidimicrobiales bacterium]
MRVAAIQTTATIARGANLEAAAALVVRAAEAGAELVVLPEYFSVAGDGEHLRAGAETLQGPTVVWASNLARRHRIWLLAGSFPELAPPLPAVDAVRGAGPRSGHQLANTSCLIDPTGAPAAVYRKIHLFDVTVAGAEHRESDTIVPGNTLGLARLGSPGGGAGIEAPLEGRLNPPPDRGSSPVLGLSICYDLRFPGLYRALALGGATVVAVPAAFTAVTGAAHWEVLLRARAIDNQVFVIGSGQVGVLPRGFPPCHGHSMIVDPWGEVLGERVDPSPGVVVADLDFGRQQEIRRELPVLADRHPTLYAGCDDN